MKIHELTLSRTGLKRASFELFQGEVLAIAGPNGAGKSTLLSAMVGELLPDGGSVLLDGVPLDAFHRRERAKRIGLLPQESQLSFPFLVEEVVGLGRIPHGPGQASREVVRGAMEAAAVSHLAGRPYPRLSGGERQRVQLARVLAQLWEAREEGNGYLFLDEPTASLDPAHQHTVLEMARELAGRGCSVVVVLHDLNLAARYADRVLLLGARGIEALGAPREVFTPTLLASLYGIEATILEDPVHGAPLVVHGRMAG